MSGVRERPRLVIARLLALALLVGVGIAIGALIDDSGPDTAPQVESQLKRVRNVSDERADRLDRTAVEQQRLQTELDESLSRARELTRANSVLRRDLRAAKRALRRTQRARRSRSR